MGAASGDALRLFVCAIYSRASSCSLAVLLSRYQHMAGKIKISESQWLRVDRGMGSPVWTRLELNPCLWAELGHKILAHCTSGVMLGSRKWPNPICRRCRARGGGPFTAFLFFLPFFFCFCFVFVFFFFSVSFIFFFEIFIKKENIKLCRKENKKENT